MLPKLTQVCSKYLKQYITCSNVISVMLLAHAHNAEELETICLDFICLNEQAILRSNEWKLFKKANQRANSLNGYFLEQIIEYKSKNFVQHAIELFVRENSRIAKTKIVPEPLPEGANFRKGRNTGSQIAGQNGRIEQSSSSSSSSEAGYSKQSSSDDGIDHKEPREAHVDLEKLMKTSSYVFVDSHHKLSDYDLQELKSLKSLPTLKPNSSNKENNMNLANQPQNKSEIP